MADQARDASQAGPDITLAHGFAAMADARALLAVSGGPDSMALLHLAARWASSLKPAPALHVATVDHGLRDGSAEEARLVASAAAALDLPHATLLWTGAKPESGIQERARAARYALLAAHAKAVGASHILTAHHADDQAETVLMRLGRGSGIGGLAGMRRLSVLAPGLQLARPLLDIPKAELVAYCRAHNLVFVEDPSNRDPAYARARLRDAAAVLAGIGLHAPGLGRLAARMARADAALEAETDRIEALLQPAHSSGAWEADLHGHAEIAPEIALRLTGRAVAHVAGDAPLRLERLEALCDALWTALASGTAYRATLAGTLVRLDRDGRLRVTREPARRRGRDAAGCRPPG